MRVLSLEAGMRIFFNAFVFCLVACSLAESGLAEGGQTRLTQEQFTDEVIAALTAKDAVDCVRRTDEGSFTFGAGAEDCSERAMYTDNLYAAYLADADRKDELISRLVTVATNALEGGDQAADLPRDYHERLVVILRPSTYGTGILNGTPPLKLVMRPFAGDMSTILALDSADTLMPMTKPMLDQAELSEDDLYALAFVNTSRRIGPIENERDGDLEYVYAPSGLATGVLALPSSCMADTQPYYALVLDRDTYVSAPASAETGVSTLAAHVLKLQSANTGFSQSLMYCRYGTWSDADVKALVE